MTNKAAHKIRQFKKSSKDQTPTAAPKAKHWLFWIFAVLSVSAIIYLSYLTYTSELKPELVMSFIVAITVLFLLIIWYVPKFYIRSLPIETGTNFDREKERLKLEDDTRKTFAQIIGGIVFLGGLIFTYNTFRLQQEGQFTDRFTKAVAQIGDDKLEVRLGGLYALERIAKDSSKDHWTVIEILSAYIREKANKRVGTAERNDNNNSVNDTIEKTEIRVKIATDIQAALTIIKRRKTMQDSKTDNIDLSGADLSGAKLIFADLNRANLRETNLIGADLIGANLIGANLRGTNLIGADLSAVNLREANLIGANLFRLDLTGADLRGADLRGADLRETKSLTFYQMEKAIINEYTKLPDNLESRKAELLEISKRNLEERSISIEEIK